jgi:hypothetical protein
METKSPVRGRFIFLCLKERQSMYKPSVSSLLHEVFFVDGLDPLVRYCIEEPPSGVLVDVVSGMRIGTDKMIPVYNLNPYWPVIRCNISSQGSARIIGNQDEPLSQALDAIAHGDPPGHNPNFQRRAIRIAVPLRVRILPGNKDNWRPGNISSLCASGCLVITYNLPQPGEAVHLEILDMSDNPQKCEAKTVWTRRWEDSAQLPCAGFSFGPDTVSPCFKRALADFLFDSFQKK